MSKLLEKISQISICLKEEQGSINEISLFEPLARNTNFEETKKPIQQRKWSYTYKLPFLRRLTLRVQAFLFKKTRLFIPVERLTSEAKFKTVLAILLAQEALREFFFSNEKRKNNFFQAAEQAAQIIGFKDFTIPNGQTPIKISQHLTWISGKKLSLIDDPAELNLQIAALKHEERDEILFRILNHIERPPITSILEVMHGEQTEKISLTTTYAQYKITNIHLDNGKIAYHYLKDHTTSSIRTSRNMRFGEKGVANQRYVHDALHGERVGSYSGELNNEWRILEQLLFILGVEKEEIYLLDKAPYTEEKSIILTSLFSWHEIGLISEQHAAIRNLNRKVLKIGADRFIRLHLLHFNISFNTLNKYPTPAETGALIKDINDQTMISLTYTLWKMTGFHSNELFQLQTIMDEIAYESNYFKHQASLLEAIDRFRKGKKQLIQQLETCPETPLIQTALVLLRDKKPDGKLLCGMDLLLYLNLFAKQLGYLHNKNCQNATDRSGGASAADKAQYAYHKVYGRSFLPGYTQGKEITLFEVLYSMYLVWEEPEINAALSTGCMGEKFYHNFFQKHPETTRYLTKWLKKPSDLDL